ncbi:MAG TPA: hypothetical protein VGR73_05420 [Bryobacteraceae bacterium]|nr:hypothetical protein [Bryobacteraceae bacterium]
MLSAVWRLSRGYRLRPWRSPYLRWRIETYAGWHAERVTARDFWRFVWNNRRELIRFLRWADRLQSRRVRPTRNFPAKLP